MPELSKQCSKCGEEFPATTEYFSRHYGGLRPDCKKCRSQYAAKRYQDNQEAILARNRAWKDANRDKVAAQAKRWAQDNPERYRENQRRWREEHPSKNTEYMARWRESHREQYNEREREYRPSYHREMTPAQRERFRARRAKHVALRRSAGTLTTNDVLRQMKAQNGRCRWCSESLTHRYDVDHVVPVTRGGLTTPENTVIACASCNRRKNNRLPFTEWLPPNPLTL